MVCGIELCERLNILSSFVKMAVWLTQLTQLTIQDRRREVKLIARLHLLPKIRMSGGLLPLLLSSLRCDV
jgi:hypothetical protein